MWYLRCSALLTSGFDEALKKVWIDAEFLFEKKVDMNLLYCWSRAFISLQRVHFRFHVFTSCLISIHRFGA
jgi:hypothetical protein